MNGQQPEDNLNSPRQTLGETSPDGQGIPAPASFNSQGAGFGAPAQPQSAWNPGSVPAPGPIAGAPSAPTPVNLAASPAGVAPSAPTPAPAPSIPRPMAPVPAVGASGAPVPPPPTAAQFEVRTMKSDAESLKQTGGSEPVPQSFSPAAMNGGEAAFNPNAGQNKSGKGVEKIIITIVVIIGVIGVGILGYMFVKPLLVAPTPAPTPVMPVPNPEDVAPPAEIPSVIPGEGVTPAAENPITPVAPALTHASFFTLAADKSEDRVISALALSDIKSVFSPAAGDAPADASLREVVIKIGEAPVAFSDFLATLFPGMSADAIKSAFSPDFTLFVYKDKTADLPGFIAKADPTAAPDVLAAFSTSLESATTLGNLYPEDPGTIGAFKDSTVNSKPVKYAAFSKAGYAFDYGWFKASDGAQYIVVSSSYAGMKEAVRRAGF